MMFLSDIEIGQIINKIGYFKWRKKKHNLTEAEAKHEGPLPKHINSGIVTSFCIVTHGCYRLRMLWKTGPNKYDLYSSRRIRGGYPSKI